MNTIQPVQNFDRVKNIKEVIYTALFIVGSVSYIILLATQMGVSNFFSTIMNTAYRLLIDTAFYIVAISVFMGSITSLMSEFHVVRLLNSLFAGLMKPLYKLPGAAFLGILTTFLSDNPSIIVLANDRKFINYFKPEQIPCLCNLGTSFGMGLILTTFMISQGFIIEPLIGNLGAIIGSVVSVRLMNMFINSKGYFNNSSVSLENINIVEESVFSNVSKPAEDGFFTRSMSSLLEGGKNGLDMGIKIVPGLLFVCTIIMTLTFGVEDPVAGYAGMAYEGVALLPKIGGKLSFLLNPLFGFSSNEAIIFPITSLGAVGAAISLVPRMLHLNLISGNDIAVFTAMGMCWSGYLSTHVSMMDALNHRKLISVSVISHTIGGLIAGISSHFIYLMIR